VTTTLEKGGKNSHRFANHPSFACRHNYAVPASSIAAACCGMNVQPRLPSTTLPSNHANASGFPASPEFANPEALSARIAVADRQDDLQVGMERADLRSQADSVDRPPGVTISPKMRSMRAPSASGVLPGDTVEVDECR